MHVNAEIISRRCDHFAAEYFVLLMKICSSFRSIFILFCLILHVLMALRNNFWHPTNTDSDTSSLSLLVCLVGV